MSIHTYTSAGTGSNYVSAYSENERTIGRLKMDTPQERSQPIVLHEDENVLVPHIYEGTVREVSAIYADTAVNEVPYIAKFLQPIIFANFANRTNSRTFLIVKICIQIQCRL